MTIRRSKTHARPVRRRRLSYAHVAAALALFLSLSSGALAAHSFLIISTHQVKPRALSALRARGGPVGLTGVPGPSGAKGPVGDAGLRGPIGTAPTVLAPGQTETGVWGGGYEINEGRDRYRLTASFPIALASPLPEGSVGYVARGTPPTAACPGAGQAAPGILCVYEGFSENLQTPSQAAVFDPEQLAGPSQATGRSGFAIELTAKGEDPSSVSGTFAVTAPRTPTGVIGFAARRQTEPRR